MGINMYLMIRKEGETFIVDPQGRRGAYRIGMGRTMDAALADFLRGYQKELGLDIEIEDSAWPAELARRKRELKKR